MASIADPNSRMMNALTLDPSVSTASGGLMNQIPQAVATAVQPLIKNAGEEINGSVSNALGTGSNRVGGIKPVMTGMPTKGGARSVGPNDAPVGLFNGLNNLRTAAKTLPDAFYAAEGGSVPAAQQVKSQGRGDDSMLVHMTPGEVRGLQALAVANGGSLTINPQTGLPEAGFLSSILPTVAGIAGSIMFPAASPWLIGAGVGGLTALATGDLGQGFMAGLGAFGGANLGSALSNAGAAASQTAADQAIMSQAATQSTGNAVAGELAGQQAAKTALETTAKDEILRQNMAFGLTKDAAAQQFASSLPGATVSNLNFGLAPGAEAAKLGFQNLGTSQGWSNLGNALSDQWSNANAMEKLAMGAGAVAPIAGMLTPEPMQFAQPEGREWNYLEPQAPTERQYIQPSKADILRGGREYTYFTPSNPIPYAKGDSVKAWEEEMDVATDEYKDRKHMEKVRSNMNPFLRYIYDETGLNLDLPATRNTKADGGMVHMEDGGFVMDARSVSEMGNGSSSAGLERLSQMGGMPIRGAGDGVSDSIPATIDGSPVAAVAREEAYFSPEAVKRIGGGSIQRGSDKLYSMMDKAIAARKKAGRGTDSGLGTLMA